MSSVLKPVRDFLEHHQSLVSQQQRQAWAAAILQSLLLKYVYINVEVENSGNLVLVCGAGVKDAHFSLLGETPVFAHASSDLSLVGVASGKGDPEEMGIFRERVPSLGLSTI